MRAYGWDDLDLKIGHHPTKIGIRWTVSKEARFELLDRLLEENHRRYAAGEPVVTTPDATSFQVRAELEDLLERDLLGPWDGPEEELPPGTSPAERYMLGRLVPRQQPERACRRRAARAGACRPGGGLARRPVTTERKRAPRQTPRSVRDLCLPQPSDWRSACRRPST